jgi:hypothetical protein
MNDDLDLRLKQALGSAERAPDEAFAQRVARLVRAEETLRAARRAAWTRLAVHLVATASLVVLFVLLARGTRPDSEGLVPPFSPATAGLLLLTLWVVVAARPGAMRRGH